MMTSAVNLGGNILASIRVPKIADQHHPIRSFGRSFCNIYSDYCKECSKLAIG
jgi:hypothetical protein